MSISTLVKTVVVSNSVAGEYKFEIYQDADAHFYADISRKNIDGLWVLGWDCYGFRSPLDVDEAVSECSNFVENLEADLNEIESKKA